MKNIPILPSVVLVATLVLVSFGLAQDTARKDSAPVLKSVSCPPECGFLCRSHDEKELVEIVKAHALAAHGKTLTDEQVKSFMQPEPAPAAPAKKP
jgi:predicted small metal-binding protein